jgi:predicted Fe-Mo cluster-binding NifX family protein
VKICVTAQGPTLDALLDPRFGRCAHFIFVDSDTLKFEVASNPAATAGGGAGIEAAQFVTDRHVSVVLTGHLGPNAFEALTASGIQVYTGLAGTVREAVEQFSAGRLTQAAGPTAPAHAGMGRGGGRGLGRGGGRGRWPQ